MVSFCGVKWPGLEPHDLFKDEIWNQFVIFSNTILLFALNSEGFGCVKIVLVSSANNVGLDKLFIEPGRSLM